MSRPPENQRARKPAGDDEAEFAAGLRPSEFRRVRRRSDEGRAAAGRRLTFMLIPHADRRIAHFQVHVVAVALLAGLTCGLVVAFLILTTVFSGTEQTLLEKGASLQAAEGELGEVIGEVNSLMRVYRDFQGTMQVTLREMNLEAGSGQGAASNSGDLARLANAQEMSASEVREVLDIKKLSRALSDAIGPLNEITRVWKNQKKLLSDIPNLWPVAGGRSSVVRPFGPGLDPLRRLPYVHQGVDIEGGLGLYVVASANGKVTDVRFDRSGGLGALVEIEHKYGFRTRYSSLGTIFVRPGDEIYQGQRIGSVGQTGEAVRPGVHFEILLGTQVLDPASFLTVSGAGGAAGDRSR